MNPLSSGMAYLLVAFHVGCEYFSFDVMAKPQGKIGGCTVISCDVILNYTTYYLIPEFTGLRMARNDGPVVLEVRTYARFLLTVVA